MKDLDIKLAKLYEQQQLKEKIILHTKNIENKIDERVIELEQLHDKIKLSELFFEKLESLNIRNLFSKILGNDKKQFERERQYYLINILKTQELEERINTKKFELNVLNEQLEKLSRIDKTYAKVLLDKKNQLKLRNKDVADDIIILETEARKESAKRKEINEAIDAGKKVLQELHLLKDSLEVIKDWGQYVMTYVGFKEKQYLKLMIKDVRKVNVSLDDFMDELNDVSLHYQIDYFQFVQRMSRFLEDFYDGLISDWIINKRMQVSKNLLFETEEKIIRIIQMLNSDFEDSLEEEKKLNKELESLLIEHKLK